MSGDRMPPALPWTRGTRKEAIWQNTQAQSGPFVLHVSWHRERGSANWSARIPWHTGGGFHAEAGGVTKTVSHAMRMAEAAAESLGEVVKLLKAAVEPEEVQPKQNVLILG